MTNGEDERAEHELPRILVKDVVNLVLEKEGVRLCELQSGFRGNKVARARQIVCYLARYNTNASLPAIARFLNKDHTTVMHGINKMAEKRMTDKALDTKLNAYELTLRLNASTKAEPRQEQVPAGP